MEEHESIDQIDWYPLKLMLNERKSRMLYFETRKERKEMLGRLLQEQGFETQMDQYEIESVIDEGCCNTVAIAHHKLTGLKVAIKAIEMHKYNKL